MRFAVLVMVGCGAAGSAPRNVDHQATCVDVGRTLRGTVDGVDASHAKQATITRACQRDRWSHEAIECVVREQQVFVCRHLLADVQREHYTAELCRYQSKFPDETHDIENCTPPHTTAGLYERLGGRDAIDTLVNEWMSTVASDQRIRVQFANTDLGQLKHQLGDQLCELANGPCKYKGHSMTEAHRGMAVNPRDFDAFVEDLGLALGKLGVHDKESRELLDQLRALKGEVVGW